MAYIIRPDEIDKAQRELEAGRNVGIPTETVYGLAAPIFFGNSFQPLQQIFQIKKRPFFDPLIVHVSTVEMARNLSSHWTEEAEVLASKFWPGPLTLVVPKANSINSIITSGLGSVGIRMPNHPLTLKLIENLGIPLAAPSANKFGKTSPTTAQHVIDEFPADNFGVLDGGPCRVGIESTVLQLNLAEKKITLLRQGQISLEEIENVLRKHWSDSGKQIDSFIFQNFYKLNPDSKKSLGHLKNESENPIHSQNSSGLQSPGIMNHHYMPTVPLVYVRRSFIESSFSKVKINPAKNNASSPEHSCERDELFNLHLIKLISEKIPMDSDNKLKTDEAIELVWPVKHFSHFHELKLALAPELAARELYAELRNLASYNSPCIVFFEESWHTGSFWEAILERLYKASVIRLE